MRKLRIELGLSQLKLSHKTELSPSDISKFESGKLKPYDGQLCRIASALGHPVERRKELLNDD